LIFTISFAIYYFLSAMLQLASRLNLISEPQTIKMAKLARELRSQGIEIIDLSLGEPDFVTPEHICQAATEAMKMGYTKYTPVAGIPELRQAISAKLKRDNQLDYAPDQIIVSTGAKQSLANAILCLINPGDEVLIPTPYWVTYAALSSLAEAEIKYLPCGIESNFKLRPEQLEAAITPATRLFIFSSPCNPTGSVYTREELAALAAVFERHPHVSILSDEIYEYINYSGSHQSIAQFEQLKDRTIIVNGMSKGFAMTGWRIGYLAGPKELVQSCEKLQAQFTSATCSIAQHASVAALTQSLEPTKKMTEAFKARRDYVYQALSEVPGVSVRLPEGAFYLFPDMRYFFGKTDGETVITDDESLSMYLLHKAHVSTVNGAAFGDPNCIRISFATSIEQLKEAMRRMAEALSRLK
jgi:aspartate aminotransferase